VADGARFGDAIGLLAGLGLVMTAYLAHEWGHALAALITGATIHPPHTLAHPSLFSFDTQTNTTYQFAMMSLGGFAVTAVAVWFAYGWLPEEPFAAKVARGGITVLASITLFVEVPLLLVGLATRRIPRVVAVFRPR
jgi:membrane-associated protease RseP (regulator of RpoE activity)